MSKVSLDERIEDKNIKFFHPQGIMTIYEPCPQALSALLICYASYVISSYEQGQAAHRNRWPRADSALISGFYCIFEGHSQTHSSGGAPGPL